MTYLSTAIGLTPGGSGTVHIYTQTIHRTTQIQTKHRKTQIQTIHRTTQTQTIHKTKSVALVRERTIPTERPQPVGEVSANFFRIEGCHVVSANDPHGR
jgi:hypothetical protein